MGLAQAIEQARMFIDRGEIHAAEEITERLRKKARGNAEIQFLEGCIHYKKGDFAGAVDLFRKVVERSPDDVNARVNLGVALVGAGAPAEAVEHLSKALARRPDHFIGWYNLGNAFRVLERYGEARDAYQRVIACRPDYHPAHNNLGYVSGRLGLTEESETAYRAALELHPAPDACINLLQVLKRRDPDRVHAFIHEAAVRFDDPELYSCIFPSAVNLCAWPLVERIRASVLAYAQADDCKAEILQDLLLPFNSSPGIAPAVMLAVHCNWARRSGYTPMTAVISPATPAPGDRLRVAYLSGDFTGHAVGLFMRNLLASHDRTRFEILCYSTSGQKDDMTREMTRHVDSFLDVSALDDELLARRMREDGIHLLVDLGGHTMNTRVAVLRHRPAPVQVTYLGYPNTTGLAEVDYRITDGYAEAEGGTRYTERLMMMPESFLCFGSFAERPRMEEPPALGRGYVTFGSFNHTRKLTPEAVRLWSGILQQVPGSRLLIKASLAGEACVQANPVRGLRIGRDRAGAGGTARFHGDAGVAPGLLQRGGHRAGHVPVPRDDDDLRGAVDGGAGGDTGGEGACTAGDVLDPEEHRGGGDDRVDGGGVRRDRGGPGAGSRKAGGAAGAPAGRGARVDPVRPGALHAPAGTALSGYVAGEGRGAVRCGRTPRGCSRRHPGRTAVKQPSCAGQDTADRRTGGRGADPGRARAAGGTARHQRPLHSRHRLPQARRT
ncbi:MAG: tetratricopeptide repeat protein [Gammaproteobacteria bacterium]|nr:tetratricopeptide repeat protein [Gammaproteobacteria bacterium]